jgi:hypothetical protein
MKCPENIARAIHEIDVAPFGDGDWLAIGDGDDGGGVGGLGLCAHGRIIEVRNVAVSR